MMTAEERGSQMFMEIPTGELPYMAVMFAKHLAKKLGGCSEVMITAYTIYAQCVEGLECTDDLYKAREEDKQWFREQGYKDL